MEKRKVLHITRLGTGGIEKLMVDVLVYIDLDKFHFDFYTTAEKDEEEFYDEAVKKYGCNIYKMGSFHDKNKLFRQLKKATTLYKFLKNNDYDVVHIHIASIKTLYKAVVARLLGINKIIVHSHSTPRTEKMKKLEQFISPLWKYFVTDFIYCSKAAGEVVKEKELKKMKADLLYNGIEKDRYVYNKDKRIELRKKYTIEDSTVVLGTVARNVHSKNISLQLDILEGLLRNKVDVKLMFVGREYEKLIPELKRRNLYDSIIIVGEVTNVEDYLNAMDIFLLTSFFEGLPLVNVEAQTNGLITFVSNRVTKEIAYTDLIQFLPIEQGDLWVEKIKGKLGEIDNSKRLSYAKLKNNFDIKEMVAKLEKVYLRSRR